MNRRELISTLAISPLFGFHSPSINQKVEEFKTFPNNSVKYISKLSDGCIKWINSLKEEEDEDEDEINYFTDLETSINTDVRSLFKSVNQYYGNTKLQIPAYTICNAISCDKYMDFDFGEELLDFGINLKIEKDCLMTLNTYICDNNSDKNHFLNFPEVLILNTSNYKEKRTKNRIEKQFTVSILVGDNIEQIKELYGK